MINLSTAWQREFISSLLIKVFGLSLKGDDLGQGLQARTAILEGINASCPGWIPYLPFGVVVHDISTQQNITALMINAIFTP